MPNTENKEMPSTENKKAQRRKTVRGLETIVIAIILIVIGVVAAAMLYMLFLSKWLTPAAALDLTLDPSTLLTGKVGNVVVLVSSGSSGATNPQITILDADTGNTAATCTITSSPSGGSGGGVYSSGDKITARCTAATQFFRGKAYVIQVTVTDAGTGSQFTKSFKVVAQ
jgi:flagellar biosynthesis/type III secretory pathway M-ring protein FliF/YscJ